MSGTIISMQTHDISARFSVDNTNYTTSIDNIGDNKSISSMLAIKNCTIDTQGNLYVVLQTNGLNNDYKEKIKDLQNLYPGEMQIEDQSITIQRQIPMKGVVGRNTTRDGISLIKEGTLTPSGDVQERAFCISIDWSKKRSEVEEFAGVEGNRNDFL